MKVALSLRLSSVLKLLKISITFPRSQLQHCLWNYPRSNGLSKLSAYLFMNGRRRNVRKLFVAPPYYRWLSATLSTIRLARRRLSVSMSHLSFCQRIGKSSSLTPPGSIPSMQNRLRASGYVFLICDVEVSILTLSDWVGSRLFISLMKSSEAIIFRSILYRSANLRLFCRNGATRLMACGWPPSKVHRWWSSIRSRVF